MFASSSNAAMFASVQVPEVVDDAAIAEVSADIVLDAAVVSTALFSFFAHAVIARAVTASVAILDPDVIIVPPTPESQEKPASIIEAAIVVLSEHQGKKYTHQSSFTSAVEECRRRVYASD
jgi:hypothetical protein